MIFETQRTQSAQRTNPLKERFQEEAKASAQSANAVRQPPSVGADSVAAYHAQPLCSALAPLDKLFFSELLCVLSVLCVEKRTNLFFKHY